MKHFVFAAALAVVLSALAAGSGLASAGNAGKIGQSQKRIPIEALAPTGMPVDITPAAATVTDGRVVLSYSLTNRSGQLLTAVEVMAFVIDTNGAVKAGEGWTLDVDLTGSMTAVFSSILWNKPAPEGRLAVAVRKAIGPSGAFEVENAEIVSRLRPYAAAKAPVFTKARYVSALSEDGSFCEGALSTAKSTCSCGVSSFSCNQTEQSYSFECNKPPEGQPACATGPGGPVTE